MKLNRQRIKAIVDREILEMRKNRMIVITMVLITVIMTIMPIVTGIGINHAPEKSAKGDIEDLKIPPQLSGLTIKTALLIMMNEQFMFYILMIPCILPIFIITYSIIGEKERKSLEPLLATPLTTAELLIGKSLAATSIPVALSWLSYLVIAITFLFTMPGQVFQFFVRPAWLIGIGVLGPLLGLLSIFVGLIISSRVNDSRVAQQLGGLLVLPLMGLSIVVLLGKVFITPLLMLMTCAMLMALDTITLIIATGVFERETILTRWK